MARGLTQTQLAGDDFTKAFISQLETGTSRLSLRAAQVLAGRLGVPVSELVEEGTASDRHQEIALLGAERELASGSPALALKAVRALHVTGRLRGRALRLEGRALFALDKARESLLALNAALSEFRAREQSDVAARTLYDIALSHARLDESDEGLLSALECDRALKAGDLIDRTLDLQLGTFLASTYVRRGDYAAADAQVARALALAQDIANREAQAALFASLAKLEQDRDNLELATKYWHQSLSELEHLGREHAVAETWNNLALVHLERDRVREAQSAISRSSALATSLGHERLKAWLEVSRAKVALHQGRFAEAEHIATGVVRQDAAPPRARAEALLVTARALSGKRAPTARIAKAYDAALAAATHEPSGVRAAILRRYSDALEAAGDVREALLRLREAMDLMRPIRNERAVARDERPK